MWDADSCLLLLPATARLAPAPRGPPASPLILVGVAESRWACISRSLLRRRFELGLELTLRNDEQWEDESGSGFGGG